MCSECSGVSQVWISSWIILGNLSTLLSLSLLDYKVGLTTVWASLAGCELDGSWVSLVVSTQRGLRGDVHAHAAAAVIRQGVEAATPAKPPAQTGWRPPRLSKSQGSCMC